MNAAYISILDTLHTNRKGTTAFPLEQFITYQSSPRVTTEQTKRERGFLACAGFPSKSPAWKRSGVEAPSPKTMHFCIVTLCKWLFLLASGT